MGLGIRTPVTRKEPGASTSGSREPTAQTSRSTSAGTSGAAAAITTPSPSGPPGQAQDAARTFIRRPERKRRSVDNMEAYRRTSDIYAAHTNDRLLQEVMQAFEEIPARVKDYPQMRKDIKAFLESQSDKSLRVLFELSKRVKDLESASKTLPPRQNNTTPMSPDLSEALLKRLEKMEEGIGMRLNDLEEKVTAGIKEAITETADNVVSNAEAVTERVVEVSGRIEAVQTSIGQARAEMKTVAEAAADIDRRVLDAAGEIAAGTAIVVKEALREAASEPRPAPQTYASVAAARPGHRPALHSMAVTFEGGQDTADEVLARVKKAVDARETGLKINKVRKAKNQTVILGCDTEEELRKVLKRIETQGKGLIVAPMKNKNPLVVLKDVFLDSEDDELVKALYSQNEDMFRDLEEEEKEMAIKYKKRTKNPKTAHVVVQVRPRVWQRMTEAGALYLDLQRVRVEDQSPLIQCTRCLAFGHGRKFCTESADKCSHCGGPHLREKCVEHVAGNEPQCCNCLHSKFTKTDHNAFSVECPVRKKWDYLARTTTAYA